MTFRLTRSFFWVDSRLRLVIAIGLLGGITGATLPAESGALLVVGMAGAEVEAEALEAQAAQAKAALIKRGVPPEQIRVLAGKVTRDQVLAAARDSAQRKPEGEYWVMLFGHVGTAAGDQPAFQVRGPRITAADLKTALAAIPGEKKVVIATERSGEFLPALKGNGFTVLTATAGAGEVNAPRFPDHWLEELTQNPKGDLNEIAAKAAASVMAEYEQLGLAQGEHARLLTPRDEILEPPFGVTNGSSVALPGPITSATGTVAVASIQIPKAEWGGEFSHQPATDETRQLLAEAQKVANPEGYAAVVLRQELTQVIHADRSTTEGWRLRVLLLKPESFDEWAEYRFGQDAPRSEYRVESGRIILPDATSWVLDAAKLSSASPDVKTGVGSDLRVLFPQAQPGSIVEIAFRHDQRAEMVLPEFYEELSLQRSVPVLRTEVTVKVPGSAAYFFKLKNADVKPVESASEQTRSLTWMLGPLTAYEPLPLDPPRRDLSVWLGISSLPSWEQFAKWYGRISNGSQTAGPAVKALAEQIAAANPQRLDRIRAAFEFVSSLRYVAIELGIQGFRPRTPEVVLRQLYGDCKDKANLLGALLREMGIPAQFALINRGSSSDPDFPGWQFNHAIAYLPEENQWLDSTDTTTPFGFIAPGNLGRSALVFSGNETASFKTVTSPSVSSLREEWSLHQDPDQQWNGRLVQRWTGIGERAFRERLAALSPAQRQDYLQRELARLLPWGEFSAIQTTEPKALTAPMRLECQVATTHDSAPSAGLALSPHFAAVERNRPMVINDGQPLRYEQSVEWKSAASGTDAALPPAFQREVAGMALSIHYRRRDAQTVERVAICDLRQPIIAPADYAAVRSAYREWLKLLQTPVKNPT